MRGKIIYAITNSANGKKYVGSTGSTLEHRYYSHLSQLRGNRHTNYLLQNDFNKYGESSFSIEKLAESDPFSRNAEEYFWIERLKTYDERYGYNTTETGVSKIRKRHGLSGVKSPLKGRKQTGYIWGLDRRMHYIDENSFSFADEVLTSIEIEYCRERLKGRTYKEIGDRFGVSRQRVQQIIKKCIVKSQNYRSQQKYKETS